jgi:hypothetical protein
MAARRLVRDSKRLRGGVMSEREGDAVRSEIANLLDQAICSDDPEAVGRLWLMLEAIRDDAARASGEVAEHAAKVFAGHNLHRLRIEGMPPLVVSTPKSRTQWDKPGLLDLVRRKAGEVDRLLSREGEVESDVEVTLRLVSDTLSIGGGKVTGIRKLGHEPDEYCSESASPARIRVETL